jgi:hypothetical protein
MAPLSSLARTRWEIHCRSLIAGSAARCFSVLPEVSVLQVITTCICSAAPRRGSEGTGFSSARFGAKAHDGPGPTGWPAIVAKYAALALTCNMQLSYCPARPGPTVGSRTHHVNSTVFAGSGEGAQRPVPARHPYAGTGSAWRRCRSRARGRALASANRSGPRPRTCARYGGHGRGSLGCWLLKVSDLAWGTGAERARVRP